MENFLESISYRSIHKYIIQTYLYKKERNRSECVRERERGKERKRTHEGKIFYEVTDRKPRLPILLAKREIVFFIEIVRSKLEQYI